MPASRNYKITAIMSLWLPVAVCMGIIFWSSSTSGSRIPFIFVFQDILAHLLMYAALGFLVKRALRGSFAGASPAVLVIAAVTFSAAYGAIDEFHQSFIPFRNAAISDVFVDGLGSLIGGLLYK